MLIFSCGKKEENTETKKVQTTDKTKFEWAESISTSDIPDFPVKGFLNGKEVEFKYICFIKWHGSNDNEIHFSTGKPQSNCGAVVNDSGFHFTSLKKDIPIGEIVKENFAKNVEGYSASYHYYVGDEPKNVNIPWNCALVITEIGDKTVKGKIAICFKDEKKSYIAGKFEAILCNN